MAIKRDKKGGGGKDGQKQQRPVVSRRSSPKACRHAANVRCCFSGKKKKNTYWPGANSVTGPLPLTLTAVILYINRWVVRVFLTRKDN